MSFELLMTGSSIRKVTRVVVLGHFVHTKGQKVDHSGLRIEFNDDLGIVCTRKDLSYSFEMTQVHPLQSGR